MKKTRSLTYLFLILTAALTVACYESDDDDAGGGNEPLPTPGDDNPGETGDDSSSEPDADPAEPDADPGEPDGSLPDAPLPPTGVDYATQIQPIFDAECVHCHGPVIQRKNRRFDSHAGVLEVVMACNCANSLLHQKIGPNPPAGNRMPGDGPPYLSDAQIQLICDWIDEGALATPTPGACP